MINVFHETIRNNTIITVFSFRNRQRRICDAYNMQLISRREDNAPSHASCRYNIQGDELLPFLDDKFNIPLS